MNKKMYEMWDNSPYSLIKYIIKKEFCGRVCRDMQKIEFTLFPSHYEGISLLTEIDLKNIENELRDEEYVNVELSKIGHSWLNVIVKK